MGADQLDCWLLEKTMISIAKSKSTFQVEFSVGQNSKTRGPTVHPLYGPTMTLATQTVLSSVNH